MNSGGSDTTPLWPGALSALQDWFVVPKATINRIQIKS
jgi:hypothetical protein